MDMLDSVDGLSYSELRDMPLPELFDVRDHVKRINDRSRQQMKAT